MFLFKEAGISFATLWEYDVVTPESHGTACRYRGGLQKTTAQSVINIMNIQEHIISRLQNTRMVSVQNLASALETTPPEIFPVLDTLEQQGTVRMGGSVCRSSCTQCATNTCDVPKTSWNAESIVISLLKKEDV